MNTRTTSCRFLITTLVVTLASACGGGGGSDSIGVPAAFLPGPSSPQVSGTVTKGPLDSSNLEFLPIDAFGVVSGAAVATATTNADGSFNATLPAGSGDLLIRTSGGTYVDEADREPDPALKRRIVLNPGEGLEGLLPAGSSTASVTLATHALLAKTRRETQGATFMQQFAANRELATAAIGFDIIATQPANPVLPDPGMSEAQRQYAMVLGGLANLINRVSLNADISAPTIEAILAVADDFSDGRIDGMMDGIPVIVAGVPIVAFSLNDEITRFRNNNFNNYSGTGLVTVDEDVFSQSAVPINSPPVGEANSYELAIGGSLTVAAPGVLDNDTDADGNPLTAELVPASGPANASQFSFSPDGAFSYTHDGSGPTVDGFSYVVTDGLGTSGPVAVTLNVLNTPPVANDDIATVEEGGLLAAGSVLLNDTDANGDTLTAMLVDLPANGQLLFNPDGIYEYTHDGSETASDQFTYVANDGNDDSLPATVVITVTPVNDPPVANPDSISVDQGGIVTVLDSGGITVLANDTDMDNPVNTLVALMVDPPVNGQLVLMTDGTFSYEHDDSETTTDSFIYVANDGTDNSMPALVSISINDLPNAQDDGGIGFITNPGVTFTTADVLANDDPGTEPSAITSFDDVSTEGGSVVAAGAGLFSYTPPSPGPFPAPAFVGDDTFTYTITDVDGDTSTATVTITVNNRVPTALDLSNSSVNEGLIAETVGTLTTTDPDVGDTHIYSLVTGAGGDDNASFQIAGDQLRTAVALDASQTPTLSVRIQTDDQNGGTFEQAFTVSVISTTANLVALSLADVTLEPPFNPAGLNYSATVPFGINSTQVTPTAEDATSTITVNGVAVDSGTASNPIALAEGANTITTVVTAQGGVSTQTYTVAVQRDFQPTALDLSNSSVNEGLIAETVGTLTTTDPDVGDTHIYSLVAGVGSDDNASFQIAGDLLQTAVALDASATPTLSVRIQTDDQNGGTFEQVFTVSVISMTTLTSVNIASSNDDPALATSGDVVTVALTADESIEAPTVTIGGTAAASVNGAGASWEAARTLTGADADGVVTFSIEFADLAGNAGTPVSVSTDGSSVTVDATAPTVAIVGAPATFTTLDPIALMFEFSEAVTGFAVVDIQVTNGGASAFAEVDADTYMANVTPDGNGDLTISVVTGAATDLAGNDSTADSVTATNVIGTNADLTDLVLTDAALDPLFNPAQTEYTATVAFLVLQTQVTPTAAIAASTITVNGLVVGSGISSDPIALDVGENTITVVVLAVDGVTELTYTVTVTRLSAAVFAQSAYIKASNAGIDDRFGYRTSISADGSTLAVSTIREASAAAMINGDQSDNSLDRSGAVYVFTQDASGIWSQQAYIKPSNNNTLALTEQGRFGYRMAISADGDTLAVGTIFEDSGSIGINGDDTNGDAEFSGAAYVFSRTGSIWSQQAYIKASNTEGGDLFGRSVALSGDGNTLAVGADNEDSAVSGIDGNQADNGAPDSGAAYVYTRSGVVWTQQSYIKASNTESFDFFGQSIGLSGDGNTMAISAPGEDSAAMGIGGDQNDNSVANSGAMYVFTFNGVTWSQQAYLKASNSGAFDSMGSFATLHLSADGNTLAVGAQDEDSDATGIDGDGNDDSATDSGAAYIFARDGGGLWTQEAFVKASNTDAGDEFGQKLSLSPDGNRLVVGAYLEDSSAQGIDGNQADNSAPDAGAAYLFGRVSGSWSQLAYLKASNAEEFDNFGWSATLSANSLLAGGIHESSSVPGINGDQASNNGFLSGAVYVFSIGAPVVGNDTPLALKLDNQNLLEAQAAGLTVGAFTTADSDSGDIHVYSLVPGAGDTDNASFQIVGSQLQTAAVLSATPTPLQIRVSSDDQNGGTIEQVFQISVRAPNNAPTDIVIDTMDLPEFANAPGAILSTVDPDVNDAHAYTFVPGVGSDNNDLFSVSPFGELFAELDALQTPTVNIRVQTDDTFGGLLEKTFTLNVIPSVLLSDLSVSGVTLDQVFAPTLLDYTATVPFGVSSTTVTPTTTLVGGLIQVNGVFVASGGTSSAIALTEGVNIIDVVMSNEFGLERNYTITITRQPTNSIYAIGDTGPGGGQVFYIEPGSGGMAGLEVAPADLIDPLDLDNLVPWGCSGTFTGAFGLAVGDGATNTALIVADTCSSLGNEAAEVAAAYNGGGFSDWFLPSQDELDLMYLNLHNQVPALGGFATDFYWSSSEIDGDSAWSQDFSNATPTDSSKNGGAGRVRAARAFGAAPTFAIGDTGPGGGLVFYIEPGSGGAAGLEAAPADQVDPLDLDPFMPWGCNGTVTGATGLAVGDGATNTAVIVADACSSVGNEAAQVAAAYNGGGFTDWFLPSQDELALMHANLHNPPFGGFGNDGNYWSSSEFDNGFAWYQNVSGFQDNTGKLNGLLVRAARAFGAAPTFAIGDTGPGGGLVFYIEPGSGGAAGLEAAPADLIDPLDLDNLMLWGCDGTATGATGQAVGDGATNTAVIVADACSSVGNEAAEVAAAYNGGGFSDWFMPSRSELDLMYLNLHNQVPALGGFANLNYWSSSEFDDGVAYLQGFDNGSHQIGVKFSNYLVRAARAFGAAPTYAIGDTGPGGGLVFYIEPGSGGMAGLEAAPTDLVDPLDLDSLMPWGCSGTITGATGLAVGDGATNTALIVADACSSVGNEAAEVAAAYNGGGFTDWFMPSQDELGLMYLNLYNQVPALGGFAIDFYWSSSEIDNDSAWSQDFSNATPTDSSKNGGAGRVRAARAFGSVPTYAIGDTGPGGGLVFYIAPGSGGMAGLEAAPADLEDLLNPGVGDFTMPWGCSGVVTGATGLAVGDGATNTALIVADACSSVGNEAAEVAAAYNGGGFTDWFLPSQDELNLMYVNQVIQVLRLRGCSNEIYWSSSEFDLNNAWIQGCNNGNQFETVKFSDFNRVRAARAFGPTPTYAIGDSGPGGGLVFYIEPGSGGAAGLEAAPADLIDPLDLDNFMSWGCFGVVTGATGLAVGDGATNTAVIVADACSSVDNEAAEVAAAYNGGGFNDWFLPSQNELDLMYRNLHNQVPALGGFASGLYWSSSEINSDSAWFQFFNGGNQTFDLKFVIFRVRAARAFGTVPAGRYKRYKDTHH